MDILERVNHWCQTKPEHAAHISGDRVLTYFALEQQSNALAAHFTSVLADNQAPIVIVGHKEPEMLVMFLAAVKSGHPYIPVDVTTPQHRIHSIVERSQAVLCLDVHEVARLLINLPIDSMHPPPTRITAVYDTANATADHPWYIIFTSGSTGEPKGVVITARCLESFVEWMLAEQRPVELGEVFLNQAPFSFDLSVMDLYLSLATGGTLYSLRMEDTVGPKKLIAKLGESNTTVWVSTPSFAQMCLSHPGFTQSLLPELRKFLFCGETLPPQLAASLLQRFPKAEVWNTYGPTEATCATTSVQITQDVLARYYSLPVGYPKPGSQILLMNSRGAPVEEGERGEIVIAGPNVSLGYLHQPDLTQNAFFDVNGVWAYRTGDQGHYQDGLLFFDGRLDQQIKLHGYRIELGDVEANLMALPSVKDAIVLPRMRDGVPHSLAAFVILNDGLAAQRANGLSDSACTLVLKQELGNLLPVYMVPGKFYYLDEFPMTTNGKADRRKLAESIGC